MDFCSDFKFPFYDKNSCIFNTNHSILFQRIRKEAILCKNLILKGCDVFCCEFCIVAIYLVSFVVWTSSFRDHQLTLLATCERNFENFYSNYKPLVSAWWGIFLWNFTKTPSCIFREDEMV